MQKQAIQMKNTSNSNVRGKQSKFNYWGMLDDKGRHLHKYSRHSVTKDVKSYCGDEVLKTVIEQLRYRFPDYADVAIAAWKLAARINEVLPLNNTLTKFIIDDKKIVCLNFQILKRYDRVPNEYGTDMFDLICQKCGHVNGQWEGACKKCKTSLVISGKKRFVTEPRIVCRETFFIPRNEIFDKEFVDIITRRKGLLFPSNTKPDVPYTYGWAYYCVTHVKLPYGFSEWWNHRLRGERLMFLKEKAGFDGGKLKAFSGITNDRTITHYVKDIITYANDNFNLDILPQQLEDYDKMQKELFEQTQRTFMDRRLKA